LPLSAASTGSRKTPNLLNHLIEAKRLHVQTIPPDEGCPLPLLAGVFKELRREGSDDLGKPGSSSLAELLQSKP
jgi:hypothetical protein